MTNDSEEALLSIDKKRNFINNNIKSYVYVVYICGVYLVVVVVVVVVVVLVEGCCVDFNFKFLDLDIKDGRQI